MARNTRVPGMSHGYSPESHCFRSLAVACGKCQHPALLPALAEQHAICSIKPLSWVATQTLSVSRCHFLAVNNHSSLPQDPSHRVPLLAAEPVLKKQMYSWSHSFGNTGRNKASVASLKECQVWSYEHRAQLHGSDN